MKRCNRCSREVAETVHTQSGWKVDYFEKLYKGVVIVTCAECREWLKGAA